MDETTSYADLEIRIQNQEVAGYPVEFTLNDQQQFQRGYLAADLLPRIPSASCWAG